MCGIVGKHNFNLKPVERDEIQKMLNSIKHRGPDDENILVKDHTGLGHVRLSILDLSSQGQQPMYTPDGRYAIVFNGEIYNYIELRSELEKDHCFETGTDTEVILAAYRLWGESCLDRFNGDWAFVILDTVTLELFGARDRYGIKPFYYILDDDRLIFASEAKALIGHTKKTINRKLVYDYLLYNRTDHTNESFFEGIQKLPPGTSFCISNNKIKFKKWYNLRTKLDRSFDKGLANNTQEFLWLFDDSLRLRLRSDVPIGVCLSGGLDSSSIVSSLIKKFNFTDVNTFSAVYEGAENADESKFIKEYEEHLANMHYTRPNAQTFFDDYQHFINAQSEPVASIGPYAQFKVMELAKEYVKVTLDGQGADEYLAGYHYFFGAYFKELANSLRLGKLLTEVGHYLIQHKGSIAFKYWLFYSLSPKWKTYIGKRVYGNINSSFAQEFKGSRDVEEQLYNPRSLSDSLCQHFEYKLQHLLKWEDHNAMFYSIEPRVPFLDHRLVEFMLSLGPENAIFKGNTKYLLRNSMRSRLPENILFRKDKKGFSTPSDEWFRDAAFIELIGDILDSNSFKQLGVFDIEKCKSAFEAHRNNESDYTKDIWKWINLYSWSNQFINR
ncbi:asparagine synthase (glutamine-hydrolyzing) [uncultured Roseivirga sp.]|uniref:asparagine synthase (glutamine-hydrolyzing) n=1 Tax=uncultured Roseivirga sp. TaxID=543088 RepID=UPI00258A16BF|nr:asparagine synthase (glutamine-hydrolyzing) [uncultured Roseivirga sp.]